MMVVFLCGLVVLVLMRTLKNDYLRYANEEEDMELVLTCLPSPHLYVCACTSHLRAFFAGSSPGRRRLEERAR